MNTFRMFFRVIVAAVVCVSGVYAVPTKKQNLNGVLKDHQAKGTFAVISKMLSKDQLAVIALGDTLAHAYDKNGHIFTTQENGLDVVDKVIFFGTDYTVRKNADFLVTNIKKITPAFAQEYVEEVVTTVAPIVVATAVITVINYIEGELQGSSSAGSTKKN